MKTIWKFPLTIAERQTINVPAMSAFLHMGLDGSDSICLWFLVDPKSTPYEVEIIVAGTGHDVPPVGNHLGTVTLEGFVWHVFTGPSSSLTKPDSLHYQTRDN